MKKYLKSVVPLFLVLALMVTGLSGCASTSNNTGEDNEKLSVYTSFYAMYDFTKKIGGDKINLTNLVPSGVEPHNWEPTPKDIANLEKADVLIYNGAGMEGWLDKVLNSINNDKLIAVETSKDIKLLEGHHDEEDGADEHSGGSDGEELEYDPHVWLNPLNAKLQMGKIKDALIQADPVNQDYYEENYDRYAGELDALDQDFKAAVAAFKSKDLIVAHEAYGYLCQAYGLNQVAIEGLNADAEPSPARMAEIAQFAQQHNVKTIFFEDLISPKVAESIAREVGAQTAVLSPLEGMEEDDIAAGKDYISVMKDNLAMLKEALQ